MRDLFVVVIVFISYAAVAEANAKSCSETAPTQAVMIQCTGSDFKEADAELQKETGN